MTDSENQEPAHPEPRRGRGRPGVARVQPGPTAIFEWLARIDARITGLMTSSDDLREAIHRQSAGLDARLTAMSAAIVELRHAQERALTGQPVLVDAVTKLTEVMRGLTEGVGEMLAFVRAQADDMGVENAKLRDSLINLATGIGPRHDR